MFKRIGYVLFVGLLIPGLANADGWSDAGNVSNLQIMNGTEVIGNFSGPNLQCGNGRFLFATDVPKEAHLFSLLLTAQVENASVKLWQVGCENGGNGTVINGAQIE
jgi:hypothetical protein